MSTDETCRKCHTRTAYEFGLCNDCRASCDHFQIGVRVASPDGIGVTLSRVTEALRRSGLEVVTAEAKWKPPNEQVDASNPYVNSFAGEG